MSDTIEVAQQLCPQCAKEIDADARFCKYCAFELTTTQRTQAGQNTGPTFGIDQNPTRNNLPLIVGGVVGVVVILIGLVTLVAYFKLRNSSATANSNSSQPSTTMTLSASGLKAEEKIMRCEALNESDIQGLSNDELRIVRNVHFARYGRNYERPGLGDYFYSRPWYKPHGTYADTMINATDKANIDLIVRAEKGGSSSSSSNVTSDGEDDPNEVLGIEFEAQKEANKFWEKRYKNCGGSYYQRRYKPLHQMTQTPPYEILSEFKGVTWKVDGVVPQPRTEAERLNQRDNPSGIAWRGKTMVYSTAVRYWASRNIDDAHAGWNPWKDKSEALETFEMTKKNGTWTFDRPGWYNTGFEERPVNCNEIPK
jgi:hypothetical protein